MGLAGDSTALALVGGQGSPNSPDSEPIRRVETTTMPHRSIRLSLAFAVVATACLSSVAVASGPALASHPFARRSGSGERMAFTAIPASESGLSVDNSYDDPAMWGARYTEFQGGAIGTGLAVGDVDGDGLVDLFVANKTAPNRLFRQVAPFRFEDITDRAGVAGEPAKDGTGWKTGVTMADVNNDGALDIYVCRFNAPNLLYLNDGAGRFREAAAGAGVALVSGSVVGAFEDYDRDGFLDLFVATNIQDATRAPEGEPDYLFRNRGDGTFEDVTERAGIARDAGRGHSATWGDFNGDGWADLYVTNDFSVPDHLYRNNGDGTFTDAIEIVAPRMPWFSMGADFADVNNDGRFDWFVADMAATTHFKSKVAMGDMGGLVDHMDTLVTPQYMTNALFIDTGADRAWEAARLAGVASTDWSWSVRFEDLDNDGRVDLHVTNGMVRSFTDSDLLARSRQLGSQREIAALMKSSPPLRERNVAFRNDGDLRFTKVQEGWGLDHEGVSFGSAFADFDNDGDLDLVYTNFDDTVSLYRNDSPAGNSIVVKLRGTSSNSHGIGAQAIVRTAHGVQVRKLTVARGALSSSEPVMHFGLGSSERIDSLEIRWPSGHMQTFAGIEANSRYTIAEPAGAAKPAPAVRERPVDRGLFVDRSAGLGIDFVNIERPFNDMKRQSLLPNRMNTLGGGAAWGDADGDGDADLYFAGPAGTAGALFLNDGSGRFARSPHAQPWEAHAGREEMSPVWLDADGDGDLDLLVAAGGVEADAGADALRDALYLNDGHGVFAGSPASALPDRAVSASVAAVADFDCDGDPDIFIGGRVIPGDYPRTPESVLLENRGGRFVDVTDTLAPGLRDAGMVTAALWTDANGDGRLDLLVAGEWMPLRLFANRGDGLVETTEAAGLAAHTGWWNSLAGADVDRDGDIDYIAGNVGLNTKYHASAGHPVRLYYGDFDGAGSCQIVEAEYEGEKLFPVRGLSCSSRAMPFVREKLPTFRAFGSALLQEIYTEQKLDESLQLAATELASGVFINDGEGRFAFRPLPRLAQNAPIFGIAAQDFDGDGFVDLFVAQNFNGPQVETGRFDGGTSLLLLGDGRGGFDPLMPARSGVLIDGEGRGVAVGDIDRDGWPDLVVTRINERAMALVNRTTPGGRSFAVQLDGDGSGSSVIGARIAVRFRDGAVQAAEIHAGAGFLSQGEPLAFFGYSDANLPESIEVAWPDGRRSTHAFQPDTTRMVVRTGS